MKVLIILGSVREASLTRALARHLEGNLRVRGADVSWIDPRRRPLPIADPAYHRRPQDTPCAAVRALVAAVDSVDGIVLASPLYHGSYSGVLKNALDCLRFDAFRNKPVGLLSHGSGAKRCAQPAEHLMPVVRTVYGIALQCQVASAKGDFAFDEEAGEFRLADDDTAARCERLADEMLAFHAAQRSMAG